MNTENSSPPHVVNSGASVMEMNANQLADFVEISKPDDKAHQMIATMLRQQQDRIGALEANLDITNKAYRIQQRYIAELEKVVESSLALNKAQAERELKR